MLDVTDAIISIKPAYVHAILVGEKTVELRRRIPNISVGSRLWLYATQPTGAITGTALVESIDRASPKRIWSKHHKSIGIDEVSFRSYFNGSAEAIAIVLDSVQRVVPVSADQLKKIRERFHPPQVLVRLRSEEAAMLKDLAELNGDVPWRE